MAGEARLQAACVRHAIAGGCIPLKQWFIGGVPDYVFLLPGGASWVVEFKSPVGVVSQRQQYVHEQMAALGHPVSVIRSAAIFRKELAKRLTL